MGDLMPAGGPPANVDMAKVREAVDAAFDPAGMTAAFVVTYKGKIIAERYGEHITPTTPLESWSMGKSLSGTLMGILMKQGVYTLEQPAPIPEWQTPGDPRAKIRIMDILHMSSGLRIIAPQDPDYNEKGPYPDHLYLLTGSVDSFKYAATRPLQWLPDTVGRYRNTDPVLTNYLIRLALDKRKETTIRSRSEPCSTRSASARWCWTLIPTGTSSPTAMNWIGPRLARIATSICRTECGTASASYLRAM